MSSINTSAGQVVVPESVGVFQVPYRNPEGADEPPASRQHGRSLLPNRPGVGSEPWKARPRMVDVHMADGRRANSTLDEQGYQFLGDAKCGLTSADFLDIERVVDSYFPEVEQLIKAAVPGVRKVLIFDHAVRSGGETLKSVKQVNAYAGLVHSDATFRSGHTRAKDQVLGSNETEVKYGRLPACWGDVRPSARWQQELFRAETVDHNFPEGRGGDHLIVNAWRPIQDTPVKQWPLALLDASSIQQEDVHPTMLQAYDNTPGGQAGAKAKMQDERELKVHDLAGNKIRFREGEVLTPLPSPEHRWSVFPQMTMDEVLLLKVFDSRRDGRARFSCHSAVFDPSADPTAHRQSIEVRCLVILEPTPEQLKPTSSKL